MHLIDADSNDAGQFVDPVPGTTPATEVDAAWLNSIQNSLCFVVTQAALALTKGDDSQFLDALKILFVEQLPPNFIGVAAAAGWTYSGAPLSALGYSLDTMKRVQLQGRVSQTSGINGATIMTLPVGARRNEVQRFPAVYLNGAAYEFCSIVIAVNGDVSCSAAGAAAAQVSLDGITFIANS